jgi:hypothetical protein
MTPGATIHTALTRSSVRSLRDELAFVARSAVRGRVRVCAVRDRDRPASDAPGDRARPRERAGGTGDDAGPARPQAPDEHTGVRHGCRVGRSRRRPAAHAPARRRGPPRDRDRALFPRDGDRDHPACDLDPFTDLPAPQVSLLGSETVDGRSTLHLRVVTVNPFPSTTDFWIDGSTYLPVYEKLAFREPGGPVVSVTNDFRWLPRTRANLAHFGIVVPPGFKRASTDP